MKKFIMLVVCIISLLGSVAYANGEVNASATRAEQIIRAEQVNRRAPKRIVKAFQFQNGLKVDGIIGPKTRAAKRLWTSLHNPVQGMSVNAPESNTVKVIMSTVDSVLEASGHKKTEMVVTVPKEKHVVTNVPNPPNKNFTTFEKLNGRNFPVAIEKVATHSNQSKSTAKVDPRIDQKMLDAAEIATNSARPHSTSKCWRYVKLALQSSGAVFSYPKTNLAKQAGNELVNVYGFTKLAVSDPSDAPLGSVVVYDKKGEPGHVEIRTKDGYVSDFKSSGPLSARNSHYIFTGAYARL